MDGLPFLFVCSFVQGLCVHSEDILRDPTQVALVQNQGLTLFCWGEDNNDRATIGYLKGLGLNGIIYDKIDVHSEKESKESIFLVEARKEQQELMKIASTTATMNWFMLSFKLMMSS